MGNFLSSTPQDLARALEQEKRSMEEVETARRAQALNLPYVDLQSFPLDLNSLSLITKDEAVASESFPFYKEQQDVRIGTINPDNQLLKQKMDDLGKKFKITLYLISKSSYQSTLRFYDKVLVPKSKFQDTIQFGETGFDSAALKSLENNPHISATEILTTLFGAAVSQGSSDIHLEPEEKIIKVRYRVDGVLHDAAHLPKTLLRSVMSRIKLLSKLKLNVENVPQDGRFTVMQDNKPLDVRVSVLPSSYGEAVVMRLLGVGATFLKVEELGLVGRASRVILEQLHKPNGMIITTGPTGSGKTTTLYAFLRELNEPGVKIITLEDPVEYKVEGIQQTPIDHRVDFNFAKGLRSVLRQDPDILMVGEIRDPETAETALQAALTGHVVLTTLHTNDAAGAVPRLVTMGVKPFTIAPAVNAIIAQRLVRRICQTCVKPVDLPAPLLEKVTYALSTLPAKAEVEVPKILQFYSSAGCDACAGRGYKGRMSVYEVIEVNEEMREMILKEPSTIAIKKLAVSQGTITMTQDGLLKALQKLTDVEEIFRVVG